MNISMENGKGKVELRLGLGNLYLFLAFPSPEEGLDSMVMHSLDL